MLAHYAFTPEQVCLLKLAQGVWQRRGAAKSARMFFNEETITETMLLDLSQSYPGQVTIIQYNKYEEGKTGADWAWTFLSSDGKENQPMLVQAKRLDNADNDYLGLDRTIGGKPGNDLQIDTLIATAKKLGIPAVYAFYNHLSNKSRLRSACASLLSLQMPVDDAWGIAFASAEAVKQSLPDISFNIHHMHSIPFHCLLCSWGTGSKPQSGAAAALASALSRLSNSEDKVHTRSPIIELHQELHPIFAEALKAANADNIASADGMHWEKEYPNIAGVVIIKDSA